MDLSSAKLNINFIHYFTFQIPQHFVYECWYFLYKRARSPLKQGFKLSWICDRCMWISVKTFPRIVFLFPVLSFFLLFFFGGGIFVLINLFFFLISHPFYTHQCIHINPNLPIHPTTTTTPPPLFPLGVHTFFLCFCFSISVLQTGSSVPFSGFHIYALIHDICFSLSDLLHSVWQSLDASTSLQITQFRSFLCLSNIPLYICTTTSLSIRPLTVI